MTMPAPSVPPAAAIPVCESGADIAVVAGSHRPAQPPTSTAPTCSVSQPTPDSACSTVAPTGNSTTDGCATAPRTVSTSDPGSSGWPTCRNHSEPLRDSSARLASVSTFCTSVGRPFTPRSAVCGGLYVGSAAFPDSSAAVAHRAFHHVVHAGPVDDRDQDLPGLDRVGGDLRPVQDEVRQPADEEAVLLPQRVSGGAVDDHHRLAARDPDGLDLRVDREAGAAAAAQPALGDEPAGAGGTQRPEPGAVLAQAHRPPVRPHSGQQSRHARAGRGGAPRPLGHCRHLPALPHPGRPLAGELTARRRGRRRLARHVLAHPLAGGGLLRPVWPVVGRRAHFCPVVCVVPERFDQPGANGPCLAQVKTTATAHAVSSTALARSSARRGQPATIRQAMASSTNATQARVNSTDHVLRTSEPVPRVCTTASGQHRYAVQCTARQVSYPIRWRSRLVTIIAITRSEASAPSPIQIGRYVPMNGIRDS